MPLFQASFAFVIGIIIADFLGFPHRVWVLYGICAVFFFVCFLFQRKHKDSLRSNKIANLQQGEILHQKSIGFILWGKTLHLAVQPLLLAAIASLGALRFQLSEPQVSQEFISWYNDTGKASIISGVISSSPEVRDRNTLIRVESKGIRQKGEKTTTKVHGVILVKAPADDSWRYGDLVLVQGNLNTPPSDGEFSYQEYLNRQGIYSYIQDGNVSLIDGSRGNWLLEWIYHLRQSALNRIYDILPDPEASLLAGILLGIETNIPQSVQEAFQNTGTSHIIAISGFNFTIITQLLMNIFGRMLGQRRGAIAAMFGIGFYATLVGGEPAVIRAAIMGALGLFARQVGRKQDGLNSLGFSAALMCMFSPNVLWNIGFQLTFMATLGLILYAEPLTQWFIRFTSMIIPETIAQKVSIPVGEYFLFTLAAQVTTMPVTIYHFRQISISSLITNPAILPAQPPIMLLGGLAVLTGMGSPVTGKFIGYLVLPFLSYTIRVVEWFGMIKSGVLYLGHTSIFAVIAFYGILLFITYNYEKFKGKLLVFSPSNLLIGMAIINVVLWRVLFSSPDGKLHVVFLNTGSSDAILIQTPDGRSVLINGGSSISTLSDALGRRLPLGNHTIDVLLVAKPVEENISALPRLVDRFPPNMVLWFGPAAASYSSSRLKEALTEKEIPIRSVKKGASIDLGRGCLLTVMDVSRRGVLLLLEWMDFRALFPLGIDFDTIQNTHFGENIGPVTALLLADQGYGPINPLEWMLNLNPQVIILNVAAGDLNGFPSPETIQSVEGFHLLRTDQNGWIEITTNGIQAWVQAERIPDS